MYIQLQSIYCKNLCNLVEPHIPSGYNVHDTLSFVQEINQLSTCRKFMISFDVESLFTNAFLSMNALIWQSSAFIRVILALRLVPPTLKPFSTSPQHGLIFNLKVCFMIK